MSYRLLKGIKGFYIHVRMSNEHSEQARAQQTNGPRDVPRCGSLSLLQKPLHYRAWGAGEKNRCLALL
jgi:hypothetical protein